MPRSSCDYESLEENLSLFSHYESLETAVRRVGVEL
jgi:hypothetical protein